MPSILEIQKISKRYRLDHERTSYLSMREQIMNLFHRKRRTKEDFYALHDISFDVEPGESIGIIGKNGAGKSTLLKILSRITPPTSGSITVRGRMASLLEVGTGFHMELTGRENIFLNGIILGMTKKEVKKQFDAIVDFSGTEKFIDTPLKHFSSGMQLRLAFAVAAFLEPEILIIDEVLAVGDLEFQRKCFNKMEDVSKSGRTILFVSHNMASIQNLCSRTIYLDKGKMITSGKSDDVIAAYLRQSLGETSFEGKTNPNRKQSFSRIAIASLPHEEKSILELLIDVDSVTDERIALDIRLHSYTGDPAAFGSCGTFTEKEMLDLKKGKNNFILRINLHGLANGLYHISADLSHPFKEFVDRAEHVLLFEYCHAEEGRSTLLQEWNLGYHKLPMEIRKV